MGIVDLSVRTWAERSRHRLTVDLFLGRRTLDGTLQAAEPIAFVDAGENATMIPTISLLDTEAQELMDALWSCGLRPTEGSGSAGSLAATQEHLADMRKIAFQLLESKP